jgi:hypothetical protein
VPGEYHASATYGSQCVAPPTSADSQVYEQGVGRDQFAGLSCTARRGRTAASTGRLEPHRAGRRRSLPRCSRSASSHSGICAADPAAGCGSMVPSYRQELVQRHHRPGNRDAQPGARRNTGRSRITPPARTATPTHAPQGRSTRPHRRTQRKAAAQSRSAKPQRKAAAQSHTSQTPVSAPRPAAPAAPRSAPDPPQPGSPRAAPPTKPRPAGSPEAPRPSARPAPLG